VERTVELKYGGLEPKNAVLSCFAAWFPSPAQLLSTHHMMRGKNMNRESETTRSKNKTITLDNVLRTVCKGMNWSIYENDDKLIISKKDFMKIMFLNDITFDRNKCLSLLKNLQDVDLITPISGDRYFMHMKALRDRLEITKTVEA